ncbi:MAG TPA: molybdate ABC transporter substrate-binding protein [Cellvibrionaceae bacterium]
MLKTGLLGLRVLRLLLATMAISLVSDGAGAEGISIAAASDLKFALDEIITAFKQTHPKDEVTVSYGSSGKFFTQVQQGAPYDLFFSADKELTTELAAKGFAGSAVIGYGCGRLALWSASLKPADLTLDFLTNNAITHIAIANPAHAPYGKRAKEALQASGKWQSLEAKLVYGESISETAQFVQTGNAQVGIIALALALSPALSSKGSYWLIPKSLHSPLEQALIVTKRAEKKPLAHRFASYIGTAPARALLSRYGFEEPSACTSTKAQKAN